MIIAKVEHEAPNGETWTTYEEIEHKGADEAKEALADLKHEQPDGLGRYVLFVTEAKSTAFFGSKDVEILADEPDTTAKRAIIALGKTLIDETPEHKLGEVWGQYFDHYDEEPKDQYPPQVGKRHAKEWAESFPYEEVTAEEFARFYMAHISKKAE